MERGYTKVINIQGTDHHGTIARVRAGLQGLHIGIPKGYPDYVLHKMVTVMRDGQEVKISKRAGSYVTVRDLIEWSGGAQPDAEVAPDLLDEATLTRGRDAVRFFLISRKADTEFVFDIDLALKQNDENPVYYVQYAHARICSVLNELKARYGVDAAQLGTADLAPLSSKSAMSLLQKLGEYPDLLTHAAGELAPHAVAFYLRDLAGEFHSFYNAEREVVDHAAPRTCAPRCPPPRGRRRERPRGARRVRAREDVTREENVKVAAPPGLTVYDLFAGTQATAKPRRTTKQSKQAGGTFLGIVLGLIVGLAIAVVVALYITRAPSPFVSKVPPPADTGASQPQQFDPNRALQGKTPGQPVPQAAQPTPPNTAPGQAANPTQPGLLPEPQIVEVPGAATNGNANRGAETASPSRRSSPTSRRR